jgi:SAM-dependent methyltransferase
MAQTASSAHDRQKHYLRNIQDGFDALSDLYYEYWGEFFHFALFEPGDRDTDFEAAWDRTHERYFAALGGPARRQILEIACGGGAFSRWMADHTTGQVFGVDLSERQIARARSRTPGRAGQNLRFAVHDVMRLGTLGGQPYDAAICLDAACYFPDRARAFGEVAKVLGERAPLLLVDWCRAEKVTRLQQELILEPFCRYWAIPALETVSGYRRAFAGAGFRLLEVDDLSDRIGPNWERGYRAALGAVAEPIRLERILKLAPMVARHGPEVIQAAKDQFQVALLAKAAADSGILRYICFLAGRK